MSLILKYGMNNPRRLPVGYTQLAYIEGDGNSWIDTGFKYGGLTRIRYKLEFQYTNDSTTQQCGMWGPIDGKRPGTVWVNNTQFCVSIGNNASGTSVYKFPYDKQKHIYAIDINVSTLKYKLTFDCVEKAEVSFTNSEDHFSTTNNVMLFRSSSTNFAASKCRVYGFKIYNNGQIVRDFIPCKYNSQIGMYDRVNGTFYQNVGTGQFKDGPEVFSLPQEYQQVEYIESPNNAYINTDVYLDWTKSFEISFKIDSTKMNGSGGNTYNSPFGYRKSGSEALGLFISGTDIALDYYAGGNFNLPKGIHLYQITKTTFAVDGVSKNAAWTYPNNLTTASYPLWYGQQAGNPGIRTNPGAYYQLDIKQDGVYIRRLIPCYRKMDLVVGMYDIVNDVFYSSVHTQQFIAGPVVESSTELNEINGAIQKNVLGPTYTLANDGCTATKLCGPSFNSMYKITYSDARSKRVHVEGPWQGGPKWTYSCWARAESGSQTVRFSKSISTYFTTVTLDQQWKRISGTIDTGGEFNLTLSIQPSGNIFISDLRLESNSIDSVQLNGYCNDVHSMKDNGQYAVDFRNNGGLIRIDLTGNNITNGSICWWGKYTSVNNLIMSKGTKGQGYICACHETLNNTFYHSGIGSNTKVVYKDGVQTSGKYDTNGWHHYCITGVDLTSWTYAYINYYNNWNKNSCIRDFRIYDNKLTKEEVQEIYQKTL